MATFVLAHLSDPHLGPLPKPSLRELAGKRATGFLNWRYKRRLLHRGDVLARIVEDLKAQAPDHVAVTGDLLVVSLIREYGPARAWLEALGRPQDVSVVPGNHDVYVREAARQPQLHWDDYMRGDTADAPRFPYLRRRGPLALIGLSSAVPTLPFMATGRLGADQLQRLADLLDQSGREGLFRVVLIHHPPVSRPQEYMKRLTDSAEFGDVLARHCAELVIHGHDHAHSVVWLEGGSRRIPAIGVPSASEAPPGEHDAAGYNIYRINGQPGSWHCQMVARGLAPDGRTVIERNRTNLAGD